MYQRLASESDALDLLQDPISRTDVGAVEKEAFIFPAQLS
jgi:hypothetical protein